MKKRTLSISAVLLAAMLLGPRDAAPEDVTRSPRREICTVTIRIGFHIAAHDAGDRVALHGAILLDTDDARWPGKVGTNGVAGGVLSLVRKGRVIARVFRRSATCVMKHWLETLRSSRGT